MDLTEERKKAVLVKAQRIAKPEKEKEIKIKVETAESKPSYEEMTKTEIINILDQKGIVVNKKQRKSELIKLLGD